MRIITNDANIIERVMKKLQIYLQFYSSKKNRRYIIVFLLCIFLLYFLFIKAPDNFPEKTLIRIEKGSTLEDVSLQLKKNNVIRSEFFFKTFAILFEGDKAARWGDYYFEMPQNVFVVAKRITHGYFGLLPVKVTFPEGLNVNETAKIAKYALKNVDEEEFINIAKDKEGYLFPDTYLFLPNAVAEDVMKEMLDNFSAKMDEINILFNDSDKTLNEIVTMASILEKEAATIDDKKLISGILWKRIKMGMPLQVDSVFLYINGKNTFELTLDDLKTDSPYNTYLYNGLPPTPIANPGLDSIIASLEPEDSPYLYYLSDLNSIIHYAKTFEEHKKNKLIYLK